MAGSQLTNQDAILQENYGELNFVLNTSTQVINRLPVSPKKADGRIVRELIGYGMPSGGGAFGPGLTATPDPETSANVEAQIFQSYQYHTIRVDWDVMHHSEGTHAYTAAVRQELERLAKFQKEDMERQALGDGSGRLGYDYTTTLTGTTAGLAGRVNVTSTTPLTFEMPGVENAAFFRKGMHLEFWTDPTGSNASPSAFDTWTKRDTPSSGYYTVSTVARDKANNKVTVTCVENAPGAGNDPGGGETSDWDVVAKDGAVIQDGNTTSTVNAGNEMYGLEALIDDGNAVLQMYTRFTHPANTTFQAINASTNDFWQSVVIDGSDRKSVV